jgi:hypothetical protein
MSQAANLQHATQKVNRFAKRDPALYPLSFIVAGGLCAAGYFLYVPYFSSFLLLSLPPQHDIHACLYLINCGIELMI